MAVDGSTDVLRIRPAASGSPGCQDSAMAGADALHDNAIAENHSAAATSGRLSTGFPVSFPVTFRLSASSILRIQLCGISYACIY